MVSAWSFWPWDDVSHNVQHILRNLTQRVETRRRGDEEARRGEAKLAGPSFTDVWGVSAVKGLKHAEMRGATASNSLCGMPTPSHSQLQFIVSRCRRRYSLCESCKPKVPYASCILSCACPVHTYVCMCFFDSAEWDEMV